VHILRAVVWGELLAFDLLEAVALVTTAVETIALATSTVAITRNITRFIEQVCAIIGTSIQKVYSTFRTTFYFLYIA
jgi:hypothetical protein